MYRSVFLLLVMCSLFVLPARTQNKKMVPVKRCPVKTLNFETGLQNNGSTDIITDQLGFTWVSTRTGLQRYNGYTLQTITPIAGKDTFRINFPVHFFELNDGNIWLSFKENVLRYDLASNSFSVVIRSSPNGHAPFAVVPLKETKEGIWCMQENKGIVVYSKSGKLLQQFNFLNVSSTDNILNSLELLYLNKITGNSDHIFINENGSNNNYASINKNSGSILSFNTEKKAFRKIDIPNSNVLGLACINEKLFVLSNEQLFLINSADYSIIRQLPLASMFAEKITSGTLQSAGNGSLMMALNNHLFELDGEGNYLFELTNLNRDPVVAAGFIHQVYSDRFRRIWVITNNDIKRIENIEIPFEHFIYQNEKDNFVRSVYYDQQKKILIAACFYSGIQLYDTLGNPLLEKTISFPFLKNILTVEKLTGDKYIVITFERGWYLLDLSARTATPLKIPPAIETVLQSTQINFGNNIQRIGDDTFIIATANNVFRSRIQKDGLISAEPLLPDQPEIKNVVVSCLYDSYKNLWVGTYKGDIIHVDVNNKTQIISLPDKYGVRSFAEDIEHHIWVGTEKGLFVYSSTGNLLEKFTRENGLRNDCIYAILPMDKEAAVFASSNLGLSLISFNGAVKNFSKEMGLQENEFNTGAACKTVFGKFYFGGINGITAFYPSSLSVINDSPYLYITRLVVNDSLYNSSAGVWKGDTIRLNYHQNRLRFDLAAIGLLNTNEYVYQYRMSSFENTWQTTYLPTNINYTLEPGEYELEVSCHPILSSEKIFYKKFIIIISPPWWKTWGFRISSVLLLSTIIGSVVYGYNRRRYIKKIRELETRHKIQLEKERISRDLHDNLGVQANAILHSSTLLSDGKMDNANIVTDLQDTAKEMLHNLRETLWALKTADVPATDLWFRVINFMKQMGRHYSSISFKVEGEAPKNFVINSNKALNIVLVVQETVNNSVKHAGATAITVSGLQNGNEWVITISDNGKGFELDVVKEKTDSYGLQNMQERAKSGNFIYNIESAPGKGTKADIIINS